MNVNFTRKAVEEFERLTGCTHIIRAHQVQQVYIPFSTKLSLISSKNGVSFSKSARVVTVFSSSHYFEGYENVAACVLVDKKQIAPVIFGSNDV